MAESVQLLNFNQEIGPNFVPIGREEDLAEAAKVAGSYQVYAALRVPEKSIKKVLDEYKFDWLLRPYAYPFFPFIIIGGMNKKEKLRNTLYVITEDSVVVSVRDYIPTCGWCCAEGRDSTEIAFDSITDITVDNLGGSCNCFVVPKVTVSLVNKQVELLVDNLDGVAHLIRELRRARKDRGSAAVQQPLMAANAPRADAPTAQQSKRIYVADSREPGSFQVVKLVSDSAADWKGFLDSVRSKLGYPPDAELKICVAEVNAEIKGGEDLEANDKVIATLL